MTSSTYNCLLSVINIGNSIIGVCILAMPYCFRKCGILLSIVLIFLSGVMTRFACYLLLKSAIKARRRNFEFLAFHTFGSSGKIAVEMSVIGSLVGVCIAFFVVIGDLGPPLAAEFLEIENSSNLRSNVLMLVGLCVALPLGMLRKIDSLTSFSALSIAFYICLVLKIFAEAVPNLSTNEWMKEVNWWKSDGVLPCIPIFSMALSCQTQLFEFFDTTNDSLKRMQTVINGAVHMCSFVYIMVGSLGYIAFYDKVISGNILLFLSASPVTEIIKLGFIITIAVSFPLCLFPCRSSLHSLLFKQGFVHHELNVAVIPENRFRILTISLVIVTIGVAIMLPNIEFVLGIIGSTIGTLVCLIFPAVIFISDTSKNTTEKRMAQALLGIGIFILITCTYSTLHQTSNRPERVSEQVKKIVDKVTPNPLSVISSSSTPEIKIPDVIVPLKTELNLMDKEKRKKVEIKKLSDDQKRLEPPIPQEPEAKVAEQNADLDPQALQKEDKELQKESNPPAHTVETTKKDKHFEKQEKLLRKLEEQHEEQKLILAQQKKVLEELKLHKEIHEVKKKLDLDPAQKTGVDLTGKEKTLALPMLQQGLKDVQNEVQVNEQQKKSIPVAVEDPINKDISPKERTIGMENNVLKNDSFVLLKADKENVIPKPQFNVEGEKEINKGETKMKNIPERLTVNNTRNVIPPFVLPNQDGIKLNNFVAEKTVIDNGRASSQPENKEVQNNFNAHVIKREPLGENNAFDAPQTINKDIKNKDFLIGTQNFINV